MVRSLRALLVVSSLSALALVACGEKSGSEPTNPPDDAANTQTGRLQLREGQDLASAPECGVDLPGCGSGLTCIAFQLDGTSTARCVDAVNVCETFLECTGGSECVILESYPSQLSCAGTCTEDCDGTSSSSSNP